VPCIDTEQLECLASDEALVSNAVRRHLDRCPECAARLRDVRQNLDVVGSVRDAMRSGTGHASRRPEGMPERIGPYRVVYEIGRGGMGIVYEAEQQQPRRRVALKLIRSMDPTPEIRRRFEREAHVLGRLQHPGIAQVFEAGVAETPLGPCPYFAMELIRGEPLRTYCADRALHVPQKLALIARICDAAHHAHANGVIHRDLKPANILVDATGQPRILDFGVARAVESELQKSTVYTDAAQLVGTLPYMSPEQVSAQAGQVDARSDIYALGVLAFELLTHRLPYAIDANRPSEAVRTICEQDATRLGSIDRTFRGDVDTIVGKALEKDVSRRYQSADQMAADIRRYLANQPIVARPASALYQISKFARRNRSLVVSSVMVAVALVCATVVSTALAIRAHRAESAKEDQLVAANEARADAERSAEQAQREAARFKAVNSFLEEMLASADPSQAGGSREVTVREAIDNAVEMLESGSIEHQPHIEAAVRTTIGNTYRSLGNLAAAEEQLHRAVEILERLHPNGHESLAFAYNKLARTHQDRGDFDEAEALFRRALTMRRRLFGDEHPEVAVLLNNLGMLLNTRGRTADAEPMLRQALAIRRSAYGDDHTDVANSLNNLAVLKSNLGETAEAEALYRESLSIDRKLRGDLHPHVATTMTNLALAIADRGELDEAERLLREALELRRRIYGGKHHHVANGLNNLASILRSKGEIDEAERLFRESLAMDSEVRGESHPSVAVTMGNLASLLAAKGEISESVDLFKRVRATYKNSLGDRHPKTLAVTHRLGTLLLEHDNVDLALQFATDSIDAAESSRPTPHWILYALNTIRGKCLFRLGRLEEAEHELRHAYQNLERENGPDHWATIEAAQALEKLN